MTKYIENIAVFLITILFIYKFMKKSFTKKDLKILLIKFGGTKINDFLISIPQIKVDR